MKRANKVAKVLVGVTMMAGLFVTNVEAKGMNETGNNVLKTGKVIAIEYSENADSENWLECFDKMYFEVDGYVYLNYDFAEDMFVGDDVLVIMNTQGTENLKDDVIRDWMYWRPDLELPDNEYFGKVENGTCIGEIKDVNVNDAGMMIDFQDDTGLWYELDDEELQEHLYDLAKSLKVIVNKRMSAKR